MKTIRVAMITQAYLPHVGGAERQLSSLVPLLHSRGVQVNILTRRYAGMLAFEEIDGSPVHRFPIPGPKLVAMLSFILHAVQTIGSIRPDVIHAHELLSPTSAALLAKRLYGIPVAAKVLRGGMLGDIEKIRHRPFGIYRLAGLRRGIDAFITISREINAELASSGIEPTRCVHIPNGVDIQRFAPVSPGEKFVLRRNLGLPINAPLAIFTGRLVPEKRIDHLLKAWPQICKQVPNAELAIIGSGEAEVQLRAQAPQGVHFLGHVEDVRPYLQAADVFVLPSATEGLSNAMLEALSTGLGVVVTKVGGATDVIDNGQNGLIVPPDDLDRLVMALTALLQNNELCMRLGAAGRRTIEADYSLAQTADRLVRLYTYLAERANL